MSITVPLVDESWNDRGVPMTREMEIPRNSIDLEETFHSTPLLFIDILCYSSNLFIHGHLFIIVCLYALRQHNFLKIIIVVNINQMHFENIFYIQRKQRTWKTWKFDIDVYFELFGEMFLINN